MIPKQLDAIAKTVILDVELLYLTQINSKGLKCPVTNYKITKRFYRSKIYVVLGCEMTF